MILSNQIKCLKCEDEIYSAHRHDFKTCSCGAVSVDGGMDYLRRLGNRDEYKELSIEVTDKEGVAMLKGINWALNNNRNDLGILCAVARAYRDKKF